MRDVRALPKAHLHLHLTGAMRPATLAGLAARRGIAVPPPLATGAQHGWAAFQRRYDAARAAIRSAEDIARVVAEAAADDAADGCGWLEIQVDPTSYADRLGGLDQVVAAMLTGATLAPIGVGVILASSWQAPPSRALEVARLAVRYAGQGVVGFGLSNDERGAAVPDFSPACRLAAEAGLLVTPHAGFYEPAEHVRECVTVLGARRVGHGIGAAASPRIMALLAERSVALEVCPTSYPPFGVVAELAAVPVRALLAAGVPVALGTDDPLLFGVGLAGQYAVARDVLGCPDAQLAALARHSITASAAPDALRAHLLAGVDAWLRAPASGSGVAPETGPAAEPEAGPAVEPVTGPAAEPETSPAVAPKTSPAVEPKTSAAVEPGTSPAVAPKTGPAAERAPGGGKDRVRVADDVDGVDAQGHRDGHAGPIDPGAEGRPAG